MKPSLLLPVRAFRRDLRDRHFVLIGVAIVIAVASVTAVDMITDRIRSALEQQSSALLAADVAIISNAELDPRYRDQAKASGLATAELVSMRSVVALKDKLQLTELKAVTDSYPLRGELIVAPEAYAEPSPTDKVPTPGTVWVEARLLSLIQGDLGDRIQIGHSEFSIAKILILEPDRGGDFFNIAPRVLMNYADLGSTKLLVPGSRARRSLLVAGTPTEIERYRSSLPLQAGDKILSPETARPEIRNALVRAEQFLGLASFTTIILAGVAIALAARSFSAQQKDTVALLRTLGATRRYVLIYFSIEILLLGVLMAVIGMAIGAACQAVIAGSMVAWTQAALPAPSMGTAFRAATVALIGLTGFALPPLMNLRNVPPLRVLRSDADAAPTSKWTIAGYAVAASAFVVPWDVGHIELTLWSVVGLIACLLSLVLATILTTMLIGRLGKRSSLLWRFGVANIARRGMLTTLQVGALGLGLMALLVLSIVRNDLLDNWVNSLPADAPNQFLINIQPQDVTRLKKFFTDHGLPVPDFYPMVRGRLVAINDTAIGPDTYPDPHAQRLADREFNLSWAEHPKPYNEITAGSWWIQESGPGQFSVEQEIAETLGISLGDSLTYRVAEAAFSGVVVNLRAVRWDSMQVNFFVETPKRLLEDLPATYITSFRLQSTDYPVLRELVRDFPSVTVLDVAALVSHIRTIMNRSAATIEFVFAFTLIAGILVLIAAVQATQDERVFESALLKTLGASRRLTLRIMSVEFLTIGLLAGVIASGAAQFTGWLIANKVMEIEYHPNAVLAVAGILAGVLGVALVGSVAVRNALRKPAAIVLRYKN